MPKKGFGGRIISTNSAAPSGKFADASASGIWTIQEALQYTKGDLWPALANGFAAYGHILGHAQSYRERVSLNTAGNAVQFGSFGSTENFEAVTCSTTRGVASQRSGTTDCVLYWTIATEGTTSTFGDKATTEAQEATGNYVRGIFSTSNGNVNNISFLTIASTGNQLDFGDLTQARSLHGALSSKTRAVFNGGWPSGSVTNTIDYITIASHGNASNFGDLTNNRAYLGTCADATRGVIKGGLNNASPTTYTNVIDYITIASTGNATDFGDATNSQRTNWGCGSTTRGLFGGADAGSSVDIDRMETIIIQTTGNASIWGDMATATYQRGGACSDSAPAVQAETLGAVSAFVAGGTGGSSEYSRSISTYNLASSGNAVMFGELTSDRSKGSAIGGATRILFVSGRDPNTPFVNIVDYINTSSYGEIASDFGDLATGKQNSACFGNTTRGISAGGEGTNQGDPVYQYYNNIEYFTLASTGNATDFGDLTQNIQNGSGFSNSTRGIRATGDYVYGIGFTATTNTLDYVTIASTGNATDFGDSTSTRYNSGACASSTRGLTAGGNSGPNNYTNLNVIDYVTIATTGNATDFGDLTFQGLYVRGASSNTKGTFMKTGNQICEVTIASTGNASDFGDLPYTTSESFMANSNGHGGLQ